MATLRNNSVSGSDPTTSTIDNNTTFVQADPSTFRAVVQKLTGVSENPLVEKLPVTTTTTSAHPSSSRSLPVKTLEMGPRKSGFKLHERRQTMKKLEINLTNTGFGFTSIVNNGGRFIRSFNGGGGGGGNENNLFLVSPVSTLDYFSRGSPRTPQTPQQQEDKAIAEKGFYFHPSPRNSQPPELLPLFPLSSPRNSSSSSS